MTTAVNKEQINSILDSRKKGLIEAKKDIISKLNTANFETWLKTDKKVSSNLFYLYILELLETRSFKRAKRYIEWLKNGYTFYVEGLERKSMMIYEHLEEADEIQYVLNNDFQYEITKRITDSDGQDIGYVVESTWKDIYYLTKKETVEFIFKHGKPKYNPVALESNLLTKKEYEYIDDYSKKQDSLYIANAKANKYGVSLECYSFKVEEGEILKDFWFKHLPSISKQDISKEYLLKNWEEGKHKRMPF